MTDAASLAVAARPRQDLGVDVAKLLGLTPNEKRHPGRARLPMVLVRISLLNLCAPEALLWRGRAQGERKLCHLQDKSQQQLADDALESLRRWLLTKGARSIQRVMRCPRYLWVLLKCHVCREASILCSPALAANALSSVPASAFEGRNQLGPASRCDLA